MSFSTPVAFIIFNRPDLTEIVFEAIRQAKPKKLLVIADGPRFPEEAEKCEKTRAVIKKVDWECEVLTDFSDVNMGCKLRVSSGLDWVFSEVEEAIILEDDCLPAPSFFNFCQTLLEKYRQDERIMMIGGVNFQPDQYKTEYSYYFSKYIHIWGWASWRRAWKHYDVEMKTWQEYKNLDLINSVCSDPDEKKVWIDNFEQVYNAAIDTWDYQWVYTCWSQNGLSILPNFNMISNIGFRLDATHTLSESPYANLPTTDIWEIKDFPFIARYFDADKYTFDTHYDGNNIRNSKTITAKIRRNLSKIKSYIPKEAIF
jgi:hypothetical protein